MEVIIMNLILTIALLAQQDGVTRFGHSHRGSAFDEGPRQKPWVIEGIGKSHFQITTSNPEVQKWFDQGHTLLHSFWYFEAERAFRWCLKLEPNNAMAWWGMARSAEEQERKVKFIREALKYKDKVSERERMFIEASAIELIDDPLHKRDGDEKERDATLALEKIIAKYPDDIEAKSMLAISSMWRSSRTAVDLLIQQVLDKAPDHPGANHYRIHNWNDRIPELALDSSAAYGKIAPGIGHALHMPGHIYANVGMWHEAAISTDSATRAEKKYMRDQMAFPWNTWNYAHNANYLSYIQCQLGMAERSISGAKQLLAVSRNSSGRKDRRGDSYIHGQGKIAMMRALIQFERWKELADETQFEWDDSIVDKTNKHYAAALANIGLGELVKAEKSLEELEKLKEEAEKDYRKETYLTQLAEVRGRLYLKRGEALEGLAALEEAARREAKLRQSQNDPPFYPVLLYDIFGNALLEQKSPVLAVKAFETALKGVPNDAFALAGLVEAYSAVGDREKARAAMGRLLFIWSDADPGIRWLEKAKSLVADAKPVDLSPRKQRNYKSFSLDAFGPNVWEPYPAPKLDLVDSKGKKVTLEEYKGRNVLLVFYLGEECLHCLEQLDKISKRRPDFAGADTEVLAVSSATPEKNAASLKMKEMPVRVLSDSATHENARRFKSYDDFEDLELHSTILIDKRGRVHWARFGGDPFDDVDFLLGEIKRMNR
jgi:peroxiredoxin